MAVKPAVKRLILPTGLAVRRLPFGIGRGLRMGVDFQRGDTRAYLGLYEIELNRHLRRIARPGFRSFDIGGHQGYDALVLAKLTGARVVSVECDPAYCAEIRGNVAVNPGLPRIDVEQAFVAAEDLAAEDGTADGATRVTVDSLARRYFVPDLLKLDIEGAEVDALRGAAQVLAQRRPAILLEVHGKDLEWECLAILRAAGYDPPTVVDRRRWLPELRPLEHNRWLIFPAR